MMLSHVQRTVVLALLLAGPVGVVHAQPEELLEINLQPDFQTVGIQEPIHLTVTLRNVSGGPLLLPKFDSANQDTYLQFLVEHSSGVALFFVDFSEVGQGKASEVQVVEDGESVTLSGLLNRDGAGPLGYGTPGDPTSLRLFLGRLFVRARFAVEDASLPFNVDPAEPALFRGTILSEPVIVQVRAGIATAPLLAPWATAIAVLLLSVIAYWAISRGATMRSRSRMR